MTIASYAQHLSLITMGHGYIGHDYSFVRPASQPHHRCARWPNKYKDLEKNEKKKDDKAEEFAKHLLRSYASAYATALLGPSKPAAAQKSDAVWCAVSTYSTHLLHAMYRNLRVLLTFKLTKSCQKRSGYLQKSTRAV